MFDLLGSIGGIILVDLALSGDNALVIGATAAGLPPRQRQIAIAAGGVGAILLRIAFATVAALLLQLPLLQAIGGLVLLVIAVRLLIDRQREKDAPGKNPESLRRYGFFGALLTILIADATMSLDNVLAIGALSHGNLPLLAAGLVLSMAILLVGSALVARMIGRLPWLLDMAALVLGWTAGSMLLHDQRLHPVLADLPFATVLVHAIPIAFVLVVDIALRPRPRKLVRRNSADEATERHESALPHG